MKISALNIAKILLAGFIFFSFLYISAVSVDPDLGWHLKVGEWVFQNGQVPHADIYSHSMSGFQWVDHEWAPDLILFIFYSHGLWWIAVFLWAFTSFRETSAAKRENSRQGAKLRKVKLRHASRLGRFQVAATEGYTFCYSRKYSISV